MSDTWLPRALYTKSPNWAQDIYITDLNNISLDFPSYFFLFCHRWGDDKDSELVVGHGEQDPLNPAHRVCFGLNADLRALVILLRLPSNEKVIFPSHHLHP